MARLNKVIVIGSGIGGLCAAAAMSEHAERVKIYCKDSRPNNPLARKSVPQGGHISILLQAGLYNLEKLFPGIQRELVEAGAAQIQAGNGQQIHINNRWLHDRPLDLTLLGLSRPFLEHVIHRRVRDIESIDISNGVTIHSLSFSSRGEVTGIEATSADGNSFCEQADLIVDSSGLSGKFVRQVINQTDIEISTEERNIGIFYSTLFLEKPEVFIGKGENILIIPDPENGEIGGSLVDVEHETWCVSLHGRNQAAPPKDLAEWRAMTQKLPDLRIWERIRDAVPLGKVHTFKKPKAYWRHFESTSLPKGYLPLGDVISSLNPILGQGMTVAIGHATELGKAYAGKSDRNPEATYLAEASSWSSRAWQTTMAYERKYSETTNKSHMEIMQQLTDKHHQQIRDSEEYHLQHVLKTQMLI